MNDYDRIAAVIRHMDEHHSEQPALAELAKVAGLSESYFHRLFHHWAGVTPKDFLQCLTLEHAKSRLRESASVLDTALTVGLSGPGRLHDLLVGIEAASPGEYKSGGEGMCISWGMAETPFGLCSIGWNDRGICHMAFHESSEQLKEPVDLKRQWPKADLKRDDVAACKQALRIFNSSPAKPLHLKAFVKATPFQLNVWRALVNVPMGHRISYGMLAGAIGSPRASRAVGSACGANPVAYLIPCHRVIRETGVVQDYHWGKTRKSALLAWESSKTLPQAGKPVKVAQ